MGESAVEKHVGKELDGVEIGRSEIVKRKLGVEARSDLRRKGAYDPYEDVDEQEIFRYGGYAVEHSEKVDFD